MTGVPGILKVREYIVLGVMCGVVAVSGFPAGDVRAQNAPPFPATHRQAAEKALSAAVGNLGIPEGNGSDVLFRTGSAGTGHELLGTIAEEYLLAHGYRVHEKGTWPEFAFELDTLYVRLDSGGKGRGRLTARIAGAEVGAVYRITEDTRSVFHGSGKYEDVIPARALRKMEQKETYIIDHSTVFGVVKPIFLGIMITGLVWLLYSYRG
jgi:hypothetical protein